MTEVTRILDAIGQGDPHAAEQLLPLVYDELRNLAAQKLAREKPGQTLQATALVHEAYLQDILRRLPNHLPGRLAELLPDAWFAAHPSAQVRRVGSGRRRAASAIASSACSSSWTTAMSP